MTKKKELSYPEKLAKRFNLALESFFDKLKFKDDDTKLQKFLKVLLRVVSVLILIALSPLILVTIFLTVAFAL